MREYGGVNTSVKVILLVGIMVFVLLYVVSAGLRGSLQPSSAERVMVGGAHPSPFDGRRAYGDVEALCALGARVSGTPGAEQARVYIQSALDEAKVSYEVAEFEAGSAHGVNIIAKVGGDAEGAIALLGHYDTLAVPGAGHLGANTGASSTALLLELARSFGEKRKGRTILLVFLDAHYHPDGYRLENAEAYHGAEAFAEWCAGRVRVDAVLGVEGLGDCYLRAALDGGAPEWMHEIMQNIAKRRGYARHFQSAQQPRLSVVEVFRAEGVPSGHLRDVSYGGSPLEHKLYWHTAEDTPERVCWQSLQAAGSLLYDALATFDKRLDFMEKQ